MKKVLIFRDKLLPYSQTFIKSQAEALKNWDYMYLTSEMTNQLPIDACKVVLMPNVLKDKFIKKYLGFLYKFFYKRFIKKLKGMHFDLLHVHFGTDAIKVAEIAKDLNIPMVVTLHGTDINVYREVWESGAKGKSKQHYPAKLLALAQLNNVHFIAVSQAIKDRAIMFGIPVDKIIVSYIGVDLSRFKSGGQPQNSSNILFVGRMIENKGVQILLKAFEKVHLFAPHAKLVLIGDGPELEGCRQYANKFNLPVDFLGVRTPQEVIFHLNHSRIFCLPSYTIEDGASEGMPMVVLEAQACGVPVVTSARGGATEGIIHGDTGFAFPEKDVEKLRDYLIQLLQDDAMIERMSTNAVAHVREKFEIQRCTRLLESIYNTLSELS